MRLGKKQIWQLAIMWVRSNTVLIRHIAYRYYPFMACTNEDVEAEAILTAYLVIERLYLSNRQLSFTAGYFHRAFKTRCIQLAKGVAVVPCDIDRLNLVQEVHPAFFDNQVVKEALSILTRRQRAIAQWTLEQPTPVSTSMIAHQFNLTVRGMCKIINKAVNRLECCENTRLCKSIKAVS